MNTKHKELPVCGARRERLVELWVRRRRRQRDGFILVVWEGRGISLRRRGHSYCGRARILISNVDLMIIMHRAVMRHPCSSLLFHASLTCLPVPHAPPLTLLPDWCYQDYGGTQMLRSPCPDSLVCHYCLGLNPLHCLDWEIHGR